MASDLDEAALERWLLAHVPDAGGVLDISTFAVGQSNPTYRVTTERRELVLRRKPFGPLLASAHAIDREYALIGALAPVGYPVPTPIAYCHDADVLGAPFYLMDLVEGLSFRLGDLPELDPDDRRCVYDAMVDALGRLHRIPIEEVGLSSFGRAGNYFARQVDRWTRQYRAAQTEESRDMDRLILALSGSIPPQERTAIIHGDYRIDNIIFEPGGWRVAAVLDWELSTIGDPLADFAYLALNWVMPHGLREASLGGLDLPALGIPTLHELTHRYRAAAGLAETGELDWYFAFGLFRGVSIAQGIRRRVMDGNAAGEDAAAAIGGLPRLIEAACRFAERAGALGTIR